MAGPLHRFFAADHDRLDALLRRAVAQPGGVDREAFDAFRAGLLRHIGMEEKVLFPAARRLRPELLPITSRLRVDHGAIAALLVPPPTPRIVDDLLSVLGPHNRREEEDEGGVYDACDAAVGEAAARRMVDELRGFPEAPLNPYNDGPEVRRHVAVTLAASRRQWGKTAAG
ncbi:MAG TPA: hemerythrin domain-containing protein [Vicinamibacteria bacterium]|nr:hemerythrin domain-containing protein [Vicinamibacteria bacterium]